MNAHTDPSSQHATYAPSAAHRWVHCTASADAIAMQPEQEEGEEAKEGTAAHEELERVLGGGVPYPEHDAAYAVALAVDYVNKLPPGQMWIEQRVRLNEQIWGRCDVAHWHEPTGVLTIVDLKNGQRAVDAEENEQLRIYAAGSMFTHKLPVKWVRYAVVQPNDWRPFVPRVKQWHESVDDLYAWAARVAAIPSLLPFEPGEGQNASGPPRKSFVAGEHCRNCPLFGTCDASRDLLKELATVIAMADEARPEQVALFMALKKPIEDWFKSFERANMKKALKGTKFPGMKLVETRPHKAWRDPAEARALVMERLGSDALDVPTPAQAIERGIPADVVDAIAPRPDGGPVLAFESDKRKDWKQKTATEMFAGLAKTTD